MYFWGQLSRHDLSTSFLNHILLSWNIVCSYASHTSKLMNNSNHISEKKWQLKWIIPAAHLKEHLEELLLERTSLEQQCSGFGKNQAGSVSVSETTDLAVPVADVVAVAWSWFLLLEWTFSWLGQHDLAAHQELINPGCFYENWNKLESILVDVLYEDNTQGIAQQNL